MKIRKGAGRIFGLAPFVSFYYTVLARELTRHRGGQLRFDSLLPAERGGETATIAEGKDGG